LPAGGSQRDDVVGIAGQDLRAVGRCVDHRSVHDVSELRRIEQGADPARVPAAELDLQHRAQQHRKPGVPAAVPPYLGHRAGGGDHVGPVARCALEECLHGPVTSVVGEQRAGIEDQHYAAPRPPVTTVEPLRAAATRRSTSSGSRPPISAASESSAARNRIWRTCACAASASQVDTLTPCADAALRTVTASSESSEMDSFSTLTDRMLPIYYCGSKQVASVLGRGSHRESSRNALRCPLAE